MTPAVLTPDKQSITSQSARLQPNVNASDRFVGIDLLRGVASLAVCWFHLTGNAWTGNGILRASGQYGWLGVEMFFVISGFIIPYSLHRGGYIFRNYPTFILKRVSRLDPPYIVSILLFLALGFGMAAIKHRSYEVDWVNVLMHLGYLNFIVGRGWLVGVYWTLAIEFQYYLMMGLAFFLIASKNRNLRFAFFLVFGFLAFLIPHQNLIFPFAFLFSMGIATFQYRIGLINKKEWLILILVFTTASSLVLHIPETIAGLLAVVGIVCIKKKFLVFTYLGNISYSLYLFHQIIGNRLLTSIGARWPNSSGPFIFSMVILVLALTLFASYVAYVLIERPAQRWSSSFRYKQLGKHSRQVRTGDQPGLPIHTS